MALSFFKSPNEEPWDRFSHRMNRALEAASVELKHKHQRRLQLGSPVKMPGDTADLIRVHQQVDQPGFGLCYDPGNIIYYTRGEERPETHVSDVAPLISTSIIKDCVLTDDGTPDVMVTPGEGLVDFPTILSTLIAGGFDGPLYVECVGGTAITEIDANVRRTLAFVREALP